MKIYVEQHRRKGVRYVDLEYTSHEIYTMSAQEMLQVASVTDGVVHTCEAAWVNHVGRFIRKGQIDANNIEIFYWDYDTKEWVKSGYVGDEDQRKKGQLINWCFGYLTNV